MSTSSWRTSGRATLLRHLHLPLAAGILLLAGCGDGPTQPPPGAVAILSVSPNVLRPGDEVELQGQNFSPTVEGNRVTVHGLEVPVLEASGSSVRIRLPEAICLPAGNVPVVVRANGTESDPILRPFEPDEIVQMEPGELRRFSFPENLCLTLGASGSAAEYLVGTQSTTEVASTLTGVRIEARVPATQGTVAMALSQGAGSAPTATAGDVAESTAPTRRQVDARSGARTPDSGDTNRWRMHRSAEADLRAQEERLWEERPPRTAASLPADAPTGAPARTRSTGGLAEQVTRQAIPPTVQAGDTVTLRVPYIGPDPNRSSCSDGESFQGLVQVVGTNSIWVDDLDNPDGGFTTTDYELLSQEFDNEIYEEVTSWFGEPTDLDGNDRIVIVVSQEVNRMSRALGFVVSSDFFPQQCAGPGGGANGGEYYYARAPDPQGSIPGPEGGTGPVYSRIDALADAPRLLAHEVTHIIQFGRRVHVVGADPLFQAIWLLEGQATFAEEVVGHHYAGLQPRRNHGASIAFQDDLPPTSVTWYRTPFTDLAIYFGFGGGSTRIPDAPEECSWLDVSPQDPAAWRPCVSPRIAYGVTWSLLRWLSDHFADRFGGGEREFQRRIVDSPEWGFAALGEVLGEDMQALLASWAAMLYTEGRVEDNPLLTFPSWNLRDIEAQFVQAAHLRPDPRSFMDYTNSVQVAAASSHYQRVSTPTGHPPFSLGALTAAGDALPDHMQLWVVRIR